MIRLAHLCGLKPTGRRRGRHPRTGVPRHLTELHPAGQHAGDCRLCDDYVPDGWSHRFGYERNEPEGGFVASLRRAFAADPNTALASATEATLADEAGRDHEAIR